MNFSGILLLMVALAVDLSAGEWPEITPDVWALAQDAALVAQGGVILERRLDFQPTYLEEVYRIRILSKAGMAAAEFPSLPADLHLVEGQVTTPDGKVQTLSRREDFLVRNVVSTADGTLKEGVLIPSGLTPDCVLELRWREPTARAMAASRSRIYQHYITLPGRYVPFAYWTLGSSLPTRTCIVQRSKEMNLPFFILGAQSSAMKQGSGLMGVTYTFRNLPAMPQVPYALRVNSPSPKVLVHLGAPQVAYLETGAPTTEYWSKVAQVYYKDWFTKDVQRSSDFDAFSRELRKDLPPEPLEKARVIAERLAKRIVNVQQLRYGEKAPQLALDRIGSEGRTNLEYAVRSGYADDTTLCKLLFHLLTDEDLSPRVGLVANRYDWVLIPDLRTPFQFQRFLLGVGVPGGGTFWLDPADRLVPAGQVAPGFQGTRAIVIATPSWVGSFESIPVAEPSTNQAIYTYQLEVKDETCAVRLEAALSGARALTARRPLGPKSPTQREAHFKGQLEERGLAVAKVGLANALDLGKPLVLAAEGVLVVEPGRQLRIRPFPGMDPGLYLPASHPESQQDSIVMPFLGVQKASSQVRVPPGYVLRAPLESWHSNQWGRVSLSATQDPGTGVLKVELEIRTVGFVARPDAYESFKNYLQWVREAAFPEITLEKEAGS